MEFDIDALQVLPETRAEVRLWPCAPTCSAKWTVEN